MKIGRGVLITARALALALTLAGCGKKEQAVSEKKVTKSVSVRTGIDHSTWDRLLGRYVDGAGLVAYERWKGNVKDMGALKKYLAQFEASPEPAAQGKELGASLTNAYNAFTVSWVLESFPTESIRALRDSFAEPRHSVGGERVSLDDIEHRTLRPELGYRIHAVLSCASLSCPPLGKDAYSAGAFDRELDAAMLRWLARGDLNRFLPAEKKAEISEVFNWNIEDFQKAGGIRSVLARHAPEQYRDFLKGEEYEIDYSTYDWGLNDQGGRGKDYGKLQLLKDKVKDKLR